MTSTTVASTIATTLALTPSVLYATLGEVVGQRAGIVNLGIEGVMLVGAAVGFSVGVVTGSPLLAILAGAAVGSLFNQVFALFIVRGRTNQLATGFAVYFLGVAVSTLIGGSYIGRNLDGLGQLNLPLLRSLPHPWDEVFRQDALVWLMVPVAVVLWWLLFRTRWGLHVRAVGEDKNAAYAAGLRPGLVQYQALALAGALSGLAGAHLSVAYTKTWQDWMTQGRGFIAVAIVMLALWSPLRAIFGALLFGASVAIGLQLQAHGSPVSPYVLDMLPYVLTIVVVLLWARPRAFTSPAGLREVFAGTSK
jgi:simple sugar transport system permease protein